MSLAREILEKIVKEEERKGEPEPLTGSVEKPAEDNKPRPAWLPGHLEAIKKPIIILSQYLDGDIVYLVRDEAMALEVESKGKIAFTPDEIEKMIPLYRSVSRETWVCYLQKVCGTKRIMRGSRVVEAKEP